MKSLVLPRKPVQLVTEFLIVAGITASAHAQFSLNEIGGSVEPGNYGTLIGTSAFGRDEIGGGTLSVHKIPQIRDGIYGNGNSWIGDSENSFIGLNFGEVPLSVGRVAWGRDNTATYKDRTAGLYTLEYTLVRAPDAALAFTGDATTGWASIGSLNYHYQLGNQPSTPISLSLRHEWSFSPVMATGLRLTAPGSSFASGACIDEFEAYAFSAPPLRAAATGGTARAGNIALTSAAFGKDELNYFNGTEFIHQIADINDGIYGNLSSWIGSSESSFIGLDFNGSFTVDRIAFGRDNTDEYGDRAQGTYLLQYTNTADPSQTTADNLWITIGPVFYGEDNFANADRHEYEFSPVTATGIRLITPGAGGAGGACIDELEVYQAVPEPTAAVLLLGAAGVMFRRRRAQV